MAPRAVGQYDFEHVYDDEIEVEHYDPNARADDEEGDGDDRRQYIVINDDSDDEADDEDVSDSSQSAGTEEACPEIIALESAPLDCGTLRVGDTVELVDRTERPANHPLSGDFLRIKAMTENLKTQEVTLEGYRLRRCSYLRPLFDGKLNEVFMLLETSEYDNRPSMVQGRVTVAASEVLKKRECQFANVDYEAYDVSMANKWFLAGIRGSTDIKNYIFDQGTLVCRWAYTIINDHNNVSYGGQVRKLHRCEADDDSETLSPSFSTPQKSAFSPDASSTASASLQRTPSDNSTESKQRNAKRRASVEQLHITPTKRRLSPTKSGRYTFGDVFCGVGGASEGARQAGLHVSWGLELDQHAIKAYAENFPSALPIWENAHDFPAIARRRIHGVDILHLSCPCQFWSVAHTSAGKNDQANIETLLTIGPILKAIKPRYATLEQAPGLLQLKKHRLWFRKLINEITAQKYNVHWTVTDQAIYGLPQRRRRLIFLCAKEGFPLPAFPKAVHGPPNSGLKNWVTVGDALMELKRRGVAADAIDEYHKPEVEKPLKHPREPVDPFSVQAKCITTSGGENTHPSGTRKFTPREFAQLQGFPLDYVFTGSRGNATKQAGNAWAPVANTKYFLLVAQFLEAYDLGLINGEDEIDDLYDYLQQKLIQIPQDTRYLKHLRKSVKSTKQHRRWGKTSIVEAVPQRRAPGAASSVLPSRSQRRVRDAAEVAAHRGDLIEID